MSQPASEGDSSAATADALRRELSLGAGLDRFTAGSNPVFAAGDGHVLKLYPPEETAHFDTERAVLARIDGRLPIPTPRLVAAGERDEWWYIAMTRLHGSPLDESWDAIDAGDRLGLMREAGEAIATLHATRTYDLAPLAVDWQGFMEAQGGACRERQLARGLAAPWADALEDFLARWAPRDDGRRVLLHTEVMRQHLLVERQGGGWRPSGLFDFEPAMIGAPEYEWASVGIFLACAEPGLLRAFLEGYGAELDEELPFRIMAYALLHRYSRLGWYLERLPAPDAAGDLESLARRWFTP